MVKADLGTHFTNLLTDAHSPGLLASKRIGAKGEAPTAPTALHTRLRQE